jgi:hypothetical protein
MTCDQCLAQLATGSLRDLTPESEVMQHAMTCSSCGPLTTQLREREYSAANALNFLPPLSNPVTVAENAIKLAKRRRVGGLVVALAGAALAATIWIAILATGFPLPGPSHPERELRTETIQLSCLSPEQAGDIINPYVRARGSNYYMPSSGISAITVRGTEDELARSRDLLANFDKDPAAACRVSPALPTGVTTDGSGSNDVAPVLAPAPKPSPVVKKP